MIDSTGLGGVGHEGAAGSVELVVEPYGRCEGQEACSDAGSQSFWGSGAVAFEGEDVFEGLEDRLDALADRSEAGASGGWFVGAWWACDDRAEGVDGVFEALSGITLVADDCLAALQGTR